jgi:hypothetical protein
MEDRSAAAKCRASPERPNQSLSSGTYSTLPWNGKVHLPTSLHVWLAVSRWESIRVW